MNRSYTAESPYSLSPTERIDSYDADVDALDYEGPQDPDEFADYPEYDEARIDRRWMRVAGVAGVILFIAVVTTGVVLGGRARGSVSATMTSSAPTSAAPVTTTAVPPAAATAPAIAALPPETVTTVSPTPTAQAVVPVAPEAAAPPPPAASPRTITYRVTGNRQLIDL